MRLRSLSEISSIVEYRKSFKLKQISYCYLAKVKGEKGTPHFEKGEIEDGFGEVWLPYKEALDKFSENATQSFEGKEYITPRDILFLKEAKHHLVQ